MKKVALIVTSSLLVGSMLTGCNSIKPGSGSEKTTAEYQKLELTLDPVKDIPAYKRELKPLVELPKLEVYLNALLDDIITENKLEAVFVDKKPHIRVSVSTEFNAVTLKNGLIVINTGMLTQLQTEVELQAVIAHELMHLLNEDHLKDEMQKIADKGLKIGMQQISSKFAGASGDELFKALPDLLGHELVDDLINAYAFTKWNREQELGADLSAVRLLHEAKLNEKYMLKFLEKRKQFEINNADLFKSQNEEKSKFMGSMTQMFSGFGSKDEEVKTDDKDAEDKDSITGKYFSADTRIAGVNRVLKVEIGKENLNSQGKSASLTDVMPNYSELESIYAISKVSSLLKAKNTKLTLKALEITKTAMKGSLKNNSYLLMVLASVNEARKWPKTAHKNRDLALKDPNATLAVYRNVIAFYDSRKDKKAVLALLDKVNKELDYPNSYLGTTLELQKKYGAATDMAEMQCVRTVDIRVVQLCQKALGRALNFDSGELLKSVAANEAEGSDVAASDASTGLGSYLPF